MLKAGITFKQIMLISAVIALILIAALLSFLSKSNSLIGDDFSCKITNMFVNLVEPQKDSLQDLVFQVLGVKFNNICRTKEQLIVADDWSHCSPAFKDEYSSKRTDALINCTNEQLLELILRCWSMAGYGRYDENSFVCFYSKIETTPSTPISFSISEKSLTEYMISLPTEKVCSKLGNSDYGCGEKNQLFFINNNEKIKKSEIFRIAFCTKNNPAKTEDKTVMACSASSEPHIEIEVCTQQPDNCDIF